MKDLPKIAKMYRYEPPKSSIWGHGLRNMSALRAHSLFQDFLAKTTLRHEFFSASLSIDRSQTRIAPRFAEVLGVPAKNFTHDRLSLSQSNACLQELIRLESASPADASGVHLNQYFLITQWSIDGRPVNTRSTLAMLYGAHPLLSTQLWFETVEQFQVIRQVFIDIDLCKLNEQHLKLMRPPPERPQRKPHGNLAPLQE